MRHLFDLINRFAQSDATVLIQGETGAGKEGVADAIHQCSPRRDGPFVVLDCSAIPEQLFEDQIFGHEQGAFTGAGRATIGVFEAAHGGTLFLDEIGELPLDVQSKLLRAVETRKVRRIGSTKVIASDVRIIAATNRDLATEVNRGTFRSDLFYRLSVAKLSVPALRERRDDLPLLVEHFLRQLSVSSGNPDPRLPRTSSRARSATRGRVTFASCATRSSARCCCRITHKLRSKRRRRKTVMASHTSTSTCRSRSPSRSSSTNSIAATCASCSKRTTATSRPLHARRVSSHVDLQR
jgi:transcriptional regulator with GAF, ATPase, and Fis domain